MANNYTLGRGELNFAKFAPATKTPTGELYFGNTPEVSFSVETSFLDHYSSDRGLKEKDESVPLEVNRRGQFVTDNISPANLALAFFGSSSVLTQAAATVTNEAILNVVLGASYQLGMTPNNPAGATNLDVHTGPSTNVIVTDSTGATTYDEGDDYTIDMVKGRLTIVASGTITAGQSVLVDYKTLARSRTAIVSGGTPIEGALRYIAYNPVGEDIDYYMPYVKISPNGDMQLKGDEWQRIPFNFEILKLSGREAVYANGRPFV